MLSQNINPEPKQRPGRQWGRLPPQEEQWARKDRWAPQGGSTVTSPRPHVGTGALEFARPSPGNTGLCTKPFFSPTLPKFFNFTKDQTQEGFYHWPVLSAVASHRWEMAAERKFVPGLCSQGGDWSHSAPGLPSGQITPTKSDHLSYPPNLLPALNIPILLKLFYQRTPKSRDV